MAEEMIDVDKGIKIPPIAGKRKYPWAEMEVNDSFLIPKDKKQSAASSLIAYRKRSGSTRMFISRSIDDTDEIRYWRTE